MSLEFRYYDRAGLGITFDEWISLASIPDYKHVAATVIGSFYISTAWLATNLSFSFSGNEEPPIIFETMVFRTTRGRRSFNPEEMYCQRYATERQAFKGHSAVCRMVRSGFRGRRSRWDDAP